MARVFLYERVEKSDFLTYFGVVARLGCGELQGGFERSLGKCIYAMLKSGGFPSGIGKPWKSNDFQGRGWLVAGKGSASEYGSVFEGSSALVNCV